MNKSLDNQLIVVPTETTLMVQHIKEVLVGPELALAWLRAAIQVGERQKHPINRPLSRKRVTLLVRAMREEEFKPVGDLIRICWDAEFGHYAVDGQHRLEAIVQAEVTLPFLVYVDFPKELFPYLDGRGPRRPADTLAIDGETSTIRLAAMATWISKFERKALEVNVTLDSYEIKNMVERHPRLRYWAHSFSNNSNLRFAGFGAALYWIERTSNERAQEFITAVTTGEGLTAGDSVLILRNRILEKRSEDRGPVTVRLIFSAWDFFLKNQKIGNLVSSSHTKWPAHCPYLMR